MECKEFTIAENRPLTEKVHFLRLAGDTAAITRPGQFVSLSLPGFFLRRPFSVCDRDADSFSLLVERVGDGTALLHTLPAGTKVSVLTGLGNGFTVELAGDQPVLIGGGRRQTCFFKKNSALWASARCSSPRTAAPAGRVS